METASLISLSKTALISCVGNSMPLAITVRGMLTSGGNAEMHSHPAQYDADCFRPDILFLPHREFLLLTNEKKPKTVIHDDISLSHGGGE